MKTNTTDIVIGIDLGDSRHQVCVLNQAGTVLREHSVANRRNRLLELAREYPGARVAMEVGTHSPWISRLLIGEGLEVYVANARKLRAIYCNERKCDRVDALMLARLARADPALLSAIEHRSERAQRDLMMIKQREVLVRQRANLIISLRASAKALGIRLPTSGTVAFAGLARARLEELDEGELLGCLEPSLAVVERLSAEIRRYDRAINQATLKRYPEAGRLRQIPGVGPITSLCFVLSIENPHRFARVRDVGAYLGLVPRRDQSGASDRALPISKAGNRQLRSLLVQCAQYILGHFGADCELRRQGLRLVARGGNGAKKKAVTAVARKLAVLMLTLWRNQSDYQAFNSQQPPAA